MEILRYFYKINEKFFILLFEHPVSFIKLYIILMSVERLLRRYFILKLWKNTSFLRQFHLHRFRVFSVLHQDLSFPNYSLCRSHCLYSSFSVVSGLCLGDPIYNSQSQVFKSYLRSHPSPLGFKPYRIRSYRLF